MEEITKIVNDISKAAICGQNEPKTVLEINMIKTFKEFAWKVLDSMENKPLNAAAKIRCDCAILDQACVDCSEDCPAAGERKEETSKWQTQPDARQGGTPKNLLQDYNESKGER